MIEDEPIMESETEIGVQTETSTPEGIPEQFWDTELGEVRTDALLASYAELEQRLSQSLPMPGDDNPEAMAQVLAALGRPETPEGYDFSDSELSIDQDSEINALMHQAGFTQGQAKLVYQLASDRLNPLMAEMQSEIAATEQRVRLEQHFGGADRYRQVASDLMQWGESRLGAEALETIASSYDGVLALHQMMATSEPEMVGTSGNAPSAMNEEQLNQMVADPRYWRDRDQAFIARVTEGYSKLYSD